MERIETVQRAHKFTTDVKIMEEDESNHNSNRSNRSKIIAGEQQMPMDLSSPLIHSPMNNANKRKLRKSPSKRMSQVSLLSRRAS